MTTESKSLSCHDAGIVFYHRRRINCYNTICCVEIAKLASYFTIVSPLAMQTTGFYLNALWSFRCWWRFKCKCQLTIKLSIHTYRQLYIILRSHETENYTNTWWFEIFEGYFQLSPFLANPMTPIQSTANHNWAFRSKFLSAKFISNDRLQAEAFFQLDPE